MQARQVRVCLDRESHCVWGKRYLLPIVESDTAPAVELKRSRMLLRVWPDLGEVKSHARVDKSYRAPGIHRRQKIPAFFYRISWGIVKAKTAHSVREELKDLGEQSTYTGSNTMTLCSFEGASGSHYDYALLNQKVRAAFPMGGGNYLFARPLGAGLEVICAGETQNIWNVFVSTALWETAKSKYGATAFFMHMNPDQVARALETADLVRKYRPPMNVNMHEEEPS